MELDLRKAINGVVTDGFLGVLAGVVSTALFQASSVGSFSGVPVDMLLPILASLGVVSGLAQGVEEK